MKFCLPFCLAVIVGCCSPAQPMLRAAADPFEEKPLQINQLNETPFPQDLLANGISEGEVHVVLCVDAAGKLLDALVTAYTQPELAQALLRAMRDWEFEAPVEKGVPVSQRVEVIFSWASTGGILSQIPTSMIAATLNRKFKAPLIPLVCKPNELDRKPVAVEKVAPLHPGKMLSPPQLTGRVTLDFYIDAEGRPRMPVAVRASDVAFAITATEALLLWRFEPPTSHGRPVAVRMVQEFIF